MGIFKACGQDPMFIPWNTYFFVSQFLVHNFTIFKSVLTPLSITRCVTVWVFMYAVFEFGSCMGYLNRTHYMLNVDLFSIRVARTQGSPHDTWFVIFSICGVRACKISSFFYTIKNSHCCNYADMYIWCFRSWFVVGVRDQNKRYALKVFIIYTCDRDP